MSSQSSSASSSAQSSPGPVSPTRASSAEYVLSREGDRDVGFHGWLIGRADEAPYVSVGTVVKNGGAYQVTRGVTVSIYATEKQNLVIHACRWKEYAPAAEGASQLQRNEECSVVVCTGDPSSIAEQAVEWLKRDAGRKLGPVSKEAWVQACSNWELLSGQEVERV